MTVAPGLAPREIPQLTESYRKAKNTYVSMAGLFAAWRFLGLTLDTKAKWGIELRSPAGMPLLLISLLGYWAFSTTMEWLQCDPARRKILAARMDFFVAHGIALSLA